MSKITVIGDVMLDKFRRGTITRTNPEYEWAHLIKQTSEEMRLWWAANVAANIASLNGGVTLLWNVGNDYRWEQIQRLCDDRKIDLVKVINEYPTILKERIVVKQNNAQLLRIDIEDKVSLQEEHKKKIMDHIKNEKPEYVVVSDYLKGVLSEDLIKDIKSQATKVLVDTKPEHMPFFDDVYLIKPNFKEFCKMIGKKPGEDVKNTDKEMEIHGLDFVKKHNVNLVVTRSEMWATLITKEEDVYHLPTEAKKMFDVTWAWDTFLATITVALSKWYTLPEAVKLANKAAGIAVWEVGTTTIKKEQIGI